VGISSKISALTVWLRSACTVITANGEGLARIDLLGIFSGARGQVFAATKNPVAASGGWPLTKFGELD
jgi:hypothetical protein